MERASRILGEFSLAETQVSKGGPLLDPEQIATACWMKAVGKKIAQHTRVRGLVRNRLIVEVEDTVWQRNLHSLSRHITANLEKVLGRGIVTEMEFRVVPLRREPQRAIASIPTDDAEGIADPGLRRLYRASRLRETA